MTNVYLFRHGETDFNLAHIIQGQLDTTGLNATGRAQAAALAAFAKDKGLKGDAILSSPQIRAVETAEPLSVLFGVAVETDPRLKEMHFGVCQGVSTKEVRATVYDPPLSFAGPDGATILVPNGKILREWHGSNDPRYDNLSHPGGETKTQVRIRACEAIFSFLEKSPETNDLWVGSHGALTRMVAAHFAPPNALDGAIRNASILHLSYDPAKPRALQWRGTLHAPEDGLRMV